MKRFLTLVIAAAMFAAFFMSSANAEEQKFKIIMLVCMGNPGKVECSLIERDVKTPEECSAARAKMTTQLMAAGRSPKDTLFKAWCWRVPQRKGNPS